MSGRSPEHSGLGNFRLTGNCAVRTMCPVAQIAQSVEQVIENHRVTGSIPVPGTISEPA